MLRNVGDVDCIAFVTSPESEQQFELAIGETVAVTAWPFEASGVKLAARLDRPTQL